MNNIFSWLSENWTYILDFFLVWVLLYAFVSIIRGTFLAQIMPGASLLFGLWFLARSWQLNTLKFLTGQIFKNGMLLLIIIFQDDLKKMLAKLGSLLTISFPFKRQDDLFTRSIIETIQYFSQEKIGSLIVFERNMRLNTLYDRAIELDAKCSSLLLMAIFENFSPLHDGAVIVRKNRVVSCCAQLPLSRNPKLAWNYGMRHAAGVGITEHSDCFVIITSEETGKISLAVDGQLQQVQKADDIQFILQDLLYGTQIHTPLTTLAPTVELDQLPDIETGQESLQNISSLHQDEEISIVESVETEDDKNQSLPS